MAAMETYFKKGTSEFKKGTRVVLNADLAGIPAGSTGKVGRAIGFTPKRYRVAFDDGTESMSVTHELLVPVPEWDDFVDERDKAAEAAAVAKSAPAVSAPAPEASPEGGDARLAALMAKSKAAKAAKGVADDDSAPASTPEPAPADGSSSDGGDPRLAALMAKSKAAKAAKGITDDAPAAAPTATPEPQTPAAKPQPADDSPLAKTPTLDSGIDPAAFPAGNRVQELLESIRSRGA